MHGQSCLFCLALIDSLGDPVTLRPIMLADRFERNSDFPSPQYDRHEIHVSQIDEFANLDTLRGNEWEPGAIKAISENVLKVHLARLLGEPFVPKDWGGETSDLVSTRIHVDGRPVSVAFLLKGPSFFRPMTIAALGKPGNQIDRLFKEPAELLVLQHSHLVRADVRNMMRIYATNMYDPRRYCIIDGPDTWRILKAYGLT
jgi:hypothetical protein